MYTFKDEEISFLSNQKQQMQTLIQELHAEINETNPNVQILELYQSKFVEYSDKEAQLKHLEENLSKRRQEHDLLKSKRLE